jgi:hypothetical protein
LQLNLPHTSMRDLWVHDDDLIVGTHGRGFWILDDIAPLRETSAEIANSVHLYAPAPAWRVQRDTYSDTPLPPDEPFAANPPDGAVIDYYLPAASAGPVTFEILDGQGQVVRRYSSDDKPDVTEEELEKQPIPLYWIQPFHRLSAEAGMHRWIWDLHYAAPVSTRHEFPISGIPHDTPRLPLGPTALPGSYMVRFTAGGKTLSAPLTVKMDPRVKASAAALDKKFRAEVKLASIMNESSPAVLQGSSIREQVEKLLPQATGKTKGTIEAFSKKLEAVLGRSGGFFAPPPEEVTLTRANSQASALYGQVWQVDAEPTVAQDAAIAAVERDSADALKRWNDLKTTDLPALNRVLHQSKMADVRPEAEAQQEEADDDVD